MAYKSVLLTWNRQDPVSNWERRRNDIIYYNYQHNRNPFIDHPEYAELIWGSPQIFNENVADFVVYPNPTSNYIIINSDEMLNICIYNISGELVYFDKIDLFPFKFDFTSFESGVYLVKLYNDKKMSTQKVIVQ